MKKVEICYAYIIEGKKGQKADIFAFLMQGCLKIPAIFNGLGKWQWMKNCIYSIYNIAEKVLKEYD